MGAKIKKNANGWVNCTTRIYSNNIKCRCKDCRFFAFEQMINNMYDIYPIVKCKNPDESLSEAKNLLKSLKTFIKLILFLTDKQ